MKADRQSLEKIYSDMDNAALRKINPSGLTAIAKETLVKELGARGLSTKYVTEAPEFTETSYKNFGKEIIIFIIGFVLICVVCSFAKEPLGNFWIILPLPLYLGTRWALRRWFIHNPFMAARRR